MITVKRFTAPWCAPCKALAPVFQGLAAEIADAEFITIDVDENPLLAEQYQIRSVPTVIIEKDGDLFESFVGVAPRHKYVEAINAAKV